MNSNCFTIIFSINKKTEQIGECRHKNKFLLKNVKCCNVI